MLSKRLETVSADCVGLAVNVAVFVAVGVTAIACHMKVKALAEPEESLTEAK